MHIYELKSYINKNKSKQEVVSYTHYSYATVVPKGISCHTVVIPIWIVHSWLRVCSTLSRPFPYLNFLVIPLFLFMSPDFSLQILSTPFCSFSVSWIVQERHKSKDLTIRSIYDLEHVIFVSLGLGYFTQYNVFHFHLLTCKFHFLCN